MEERLEIFNLRRDYGTARPNQYTVETVENVLQRERQIFQAVDDSQNTLKINGLYSHHFLKFQGLTANECPLRQQFWSITWKQVFTKRTGNWYLPEFKFMNWICERHFLIAPFELPARFIQ